MSLLQTKRLSPLSPIALTDEVEAKIKKYRFLLVDITENIETLIIFNDRIANLKDQVDSKNLIDVTNELNTLKATQSRYSDELKELCNQYQTETDQKAILESQKEIARTALNTHRQAVFPQYHTAINTNLELFGANFRIGELESSNAAGRPSTAYHIIIDQHQVPLTAINQKNNVFKDYYERMVQDGIINSNARHAVARKMLTAMWAMWKTNSPFDENLVHELNRPTVSVLSR